jgi:hypothetical protein
MFASRMPIRKSLTTVKKLAGINFARGRHWHRFVAMAAQISRGFALALFVALVFISTTDAQFFGKGKGGGGLSGPGGADGGKKKPAER